MEEQTQETQISAQEEQKIIDTFFKERDSYRQINQLGRQEINDIYSAYQGRMDEVKKTPYFEPVSIPKLRTEVSYIVPFIFSGQPEIEVEGVGEEDKMISKIFEKIVNFRISQSIPNAYEKIEAWVKQATTVGTSLMKVVWRFETEDNGDGTESPVKDEPDFEVPNILDCFYNPIIPNVECQPSLIFRSVVSLDEVKENAEYDFIGADGLLNRDKVQSGTLSSNPYDSSYEAARTMDIKKAGEGLIEVFERITENRIQTVCQGKEKLVLRDKPWKYGFINAVKLVHEPDCIPNMFDGKGVGQNTLGISKAYHSTINQIKTNITLGNNPMFYGKKGAMIDKKQLVSRPGGFIEIDNETNEPLDHTFRQVDIQDVKQGALEYLGKLDDEHKRSSGANDLVQGAASNKTLGQDQLASSYSSNRFELIQRRFKEALADVAEMLIRMELENLQSVEAPILRIFPQEIRAEIYSILVNEAKGVEYNIRVKGDTIVARNKDVQIKQFTDWFNLFGPLLPPQNQLAAARKWLELRGIDGIDELVPDMTQQPQEMPIQGQQGMQPMDAQMMQGQPTQQGINQQTYAG